MMSEKDFEGELFALYGAPQPGSTEEFVDRAVAKVRSRGRVETALRVAALVACAVAVMAIAVVVWPGAWAAMSSDIAAVAPFAFLGLTVACAGILRLAR